MNDRIIQITATQTDPEEYGMPWEVYGLSETGNLYKLDKSGKRWVFICSSIGEDQS